MFIDTHAHYDDAAFDEDRALLISELKGHSVDYVINPGCDVASSSKARQIAENTPNFAFACGVHPENLDSLTEDWVNQIISLSNSDRCVAIGEIGLDYYWDTSRKEEQKLIFVTQLRLAEELSLPVIIHDRESHADALAAIKGYNGTGVFHCFSGSPEMAEILLREGWYLGFDGPITYKNAKKAVEVLKICPLDRILLETDSPYLSPVPNRGKRNDSRNLQYIAQKVAEVKNENVSKIAEITSANARALFTKL